MLLYNALVCVAPAIGACIGRAAATAEAHDAHAGWTVLETLPSDAVRSYQPYWALAAHLLARMHRVAPAKAAYDRAIGLCKDPAMRRFLPQRAAACN